MPRTAKNQAVQICKCKYPPTLMVASELIEVGETVKTSEEEQVHHIRGISL